MMAAAEKSAFKPEAITAVIEESNLWPEIEFTYRPLSYGDYLAMERKQFTAPPGELAAAVFEMLEQQITTWSIDGRPDAATIRELHPQIIDQMWSFIRLGVGAVLKNSSSGSGSSAPTDTLSAEAAKTADGGCLEVTDGR